MLEQKDTYSIHELFEELPITLVDLGEKADINEVTLARIRDGKATRRSTVNRMLLSLSQIYNRPLSLKNVSDINVLVNKRQEAKEARDAERKADGKQEEEDPAA